MLVTCLTYAMDKVGNFLMLLLFRLSPSANCQLTDLNQPTKQHVLLAYSDYVSDTYVTR